MRSPFAVAVCWSVVAGACAAGVDAPPAETGGSAGIGGPGGVTGGSGGAGATGGVGGTGQGGTGSGGSGVGGSAAGRGGTGPVTGGAGGVTGGSAGAPVTGGTAGEVSTGGAGAAAGMGAAGGTAGGGASGGSSGAGGGAGDGGGSGTPGTCQPSCGSTKWACWPMPNPAGSGLPNEASYTVGADTTVDDVTCLEWQKTPPTSTYTFQAAIDYCDGLSLAGKDDWRLPTRVEMASIVDFVAGGVDRTAFPAGASAFHKTASDWILTIEQRGAGAGKDFAWAYNLSDGIVSNAYSKATAARLRCVRGSAGEAPTAPAVPPPNQYTLVAGGEVQDNYTGLVWQQGYSDAGMAWDQAAPYCAGLALGGRTWRLPSIRELATLVDEARVAPSINVTMFPNTQYGSRSDNWYWASHRARGNDSAAWALNFDDGFTGFNSGASGAWNYWTTAWVKCVR